MRTYLTWLVLAVLVLGACAPVVGNTSTYLGTWEDITLPERCYSAQRLEVPGGWLVRTQYTTEAMVYVPDADHVWGQETPPAQSLTVQVASTTSTALPAPCACPRPVQPPAAPPAPGAGQ